MMKKFLLFLFLFVQTTLLANSMGLKFELVMPEAYGSGMGINGFGLMEINRNFYFYPNLDIWFSQDHSYDYYYDRRYYYNSDFQITVFSFNADFAIIASGRSVRPYIGMGFAPVMIYGHWHEYPYEDSYNDLEAGINMFGGLLVPAGHQTIIFELRGQVLQHYNSMKIGIGLNFK
jgi:hypothetical protein